MAHDNKKTIQIVQQTSKAINKKGKLKGKNKKETKMLKASCMHHRINKKGKLRSTVWNNDGEFCTCSLCFKKFPATFYTEEQIETAVNGLEELNNQNKFTAVAINAGEDTAKFLSTMGIMLAKYPKVSKKLKKVASKQSSVKNKKHHNGGNNNSFSQYGSWSTTNNN